MADKLLYIGQTGEGSTSLDRKNNIERLGYDVITFNTVDYLNPKNRIVSSISHRLNIGAPLKNLNNDIKRFIESNNISVEYVWVDKGKWLFPETINYLKKIAKKKIIHYTPDAQLTIHKSIHFNESIPIYDILFTTKEFEIDLYKKKGANNICLTYQAYEDTRFYPRPDLKRETGYVGFIGHHEYHYANILSGIVDNHDVKIWGPRWENKFKVKFGKLKHKIISNGVWGEMYPITLCKIPIALGLLHKKTPETTTTRSFEIPACGTFMLAERTEKHLELFEEGKEADYFSSLDELNDKINYYLKNTDVRDKIGQLGYERCVRSGYSNLERIKKMFKEIHKE